MTWDYELDVLRDVMRKAGAEALRFVAEGFETIQKPDRSPVTSADLAVNRVLQSRLESVFPQDGWLSEESPDGLDRFQKRRIWVVDPIDGTKAFINGEPEFCISVALIEEGQPVVASIFNPSTDELFTASRGGGIRLNGEPVVPPAERRDKRPVLALNLRVAEAVTPQPSYPLDRLGARTHRNRTHRGCGYIGTRKRMGCCGRGSPDYRGRGNHL
jgi:myo-inositol-1(or 4)-monophosphatase